MSATAPVPPDGDRPEVVDNPDIADNLGIADNPDTADQPDILVRAVEAALFAATEPMSAEAIAGHLGGAAPGDIRAALASLAAHYGPRGIQLVARGQGREARWHFQTAPDLAHLLRPSHEEPRRLSRAATEALAIIAYHEPVSRAEIEAIRGVQTSRGTLDVLLEAGWVRVAGRREVPGRPVIYATTPRFLAHFGLSTRRDLPGIEELRAAGLLDPVEEALELAMGDAGASALDAPAGCASAEAGSAHTDAGSALTDAARASPDAGNGVSPGGLASLEESA